jgi:soluble lytic murein transglycosylase
MKTMMSDFRGFRYLLIGLFFLVVFLPPKPLRAEIYMYLDGKGVLHFTNVPLASSDKPYRYQIWKKKPFKTISINRSYKGCYDRYIKDASRQYGVSYYLLKAIIKAESNFNPNAVSSAGAMGLMQLMPENVRILSVSDPFDPWENIMAGANFFKRMLERFDGDLLLSLAAYNAGPKAVEKYNAVPPYEETQSYVQKVLRYYAQYRREHNG